MDPDPDPDPDPYPYLCLMNPDPALDPTPDPTTFFIDFKNDKKKFSSHFFLIICPQTNHLQSCVFVLKFYFAGIISVRSTHL